MNPHEIRRSFLAFFEARTHEVVPSSPVVPKEDPTLLFTNAGMNQFKDIFLGNEVRDYRRAASSQMCIRAGGKHNDLDEVGKDGRHLTFFEMLGNWSFGDYYKLKSIQWGWEFLTDVLGLAPERLFISVFNNDDETYNIWHDVIGIPKERLIRCGEVDNFWSMGPVGPCGPCTEIHYDQKPELPWAFEGEFDGERYIELWNLVFMEFDRQEDGSLQDLKMKSVDTGMGLERAAVILGGMNSVFETELFKGIIEGTAALLGQPGSQAEILKREDHMRFCVIADHIRTLTFSLSEGQPFSNEGRGYVLRRILRRALRFGRELGFKGPFLHEVAKTVVSDFGDVYPQLRPVANQVQEIIRLEEIRFFRTIDRGMIRFEELATKLAKKKHTEINGEDAFMLYDTFGFPLDLTRTMAEERGLKLDEAGFKVALDAQRARSAQGSLFYKEEAGDWVTLHEVDSDQFKGYSKLSTTSQINRYRPRGEFFEILLDQTPFYAESGGQVGDRGTISLNDDELRFGVLDTKRIPMGIMHLCQVLDGFVTEEKMGGPAQAVVNADLRDRTIANHTATHLLHAALHRFVSADAVQAGSLVNEHKLRFDFTHPRGLTSEQTQTIEDWINKQIQAAHPVITHVDVPREEAEALGAMAIFGEKYGDRVRVVEAVKGTSVEFCGGVHVANTRDILMFRILSESSTAGDTRRIEAVTHKAAIAASRADRDLLENIRIATSVDTAAQAPQRIERLRAQLRDLQNYADRLFEKSAVQVAKDMTADVREIEGVPVCGGVVEVRDRAQLLKIADFVRDRLGDGVAAIGAAIDGKPALVCIVGKGLVKSRKLKAGPLVNACAKIVGGRGGGRPTLAQAGGSDTSRLDEAIACIYGAVEAQLTR